MLSIQALRGLPRLCAPGIISCIISFSRQLSCFLMVLWQCLAVPSLLQLYKNPLICFLCCPRNPQTLSQPFHQSQASRRVSKFFLSVQLSQPYVAQATLALSLVVSSLKSVCGDFSVLTAVQVSDSAITQWHRDDLNWLGDEMMVWVRSLAKWPIETEHDFLILWVETVTKRICTCLCLKPRPHQQHCRMLLAERFFRKRSMLLRHCCRFWQQCRTKFRPVDNVETNWTCSTFNFPIDNTHNYLLTSVHIIWQKAASLSCHPSLRRNAVMRR